MIWRTQRASSTRVGRGAGAVLGWLTVMLMAAAALRAEEWSGRMLLLEGEDGTARPPVVSAVALHPLGKVGREGGLTREDQQAGDERAGDA